MLDDVGGFDDSFFMYCEDVDLAFRGQLLGYRCVYVPTAVVYHMLSATGGGPTASYYCGRNFLRVIARDMPGPLLRRVWPRVVLAQLRIAAESLWHIREPSARAKLRGQIDGLLELPRVLRERRAIQARRRVPIRYLRSIMAAP
jgi:GT2 family glycosyltransferase